MRGVAAAQGPPGAAAGWRMRIEDGTASAHAVRPAAG